MYLYIVVINSFKVLTELTFLSELDNNSKQRIISWCDLLPPVLLSPPTSEMELLLVIFFG